MPLHLRRHVVGRADGEHLDDLYVLQIRRVAYQRTQQFLGHRTIAGHEDAVMRLDRLDRNVSGTELAIVLR